MTVPCTADEFVALIVQSGLLDQPTLAAHQGKLAPGVAPPELAQVLVRNGLLTQFQADQLLLGTSRRFFIGKYKILDRLGTGGMAQVYLGEHRAMRHRVAIKVLPPAKAKDPAAVERFKREARATAALNHPNIVRAHDIDEDDGLHYIVLEYVEGSTLLEIVMRHGPMHPQQAVRYLRQAANGLQHACEAGLVHRDIKPANLLVDRNGTVKILDLGLARFFADEHDNLSQKYKEAVLGTADYLAPEQVDDSHNIDIRADIYSLGATFYFCLTGRPPFPEGSFTQKLVWHQVRQPSPIRELRPDLPDDLVALIEKLMAKDPAERYQTPAEVATAAACIIVETGEPKTWETAILHKDGTRKDRGPATPVPSRAATKPIPILRNRLPESPRRRGRRWAIVAVGLVMAMLAAGGVYWSVAAWRSAPSSEPATTDQAVEPPAKLEAMLVVECGRGKGKAQDELLQPGYGYQLLQGTSVDGWPASSTRLHAWVDPQRVRLQIRLPAGTPATLRFLFVDGNNRKRKQQLMVQGKTIAEMADFTAGKQIDVPLAASDTASGKIDVVIEKLAGINAAISEFQVLAERGTGKR